MRDNIKIDIYNSILNNINEAVIISDKNNQIVQINKVCEDITGYSKNEVLGKNPKIFSSEKTGEDTFSKIWQILQKKDFWSGELWNKHKTGLMYLVSIKMYKIYDDSRDEIYYYAVFSDISTLNKSKSELHYLAYHDPLTNLPNRLKLNAQLEYIVNNSKRNDLQFAILFLDLDNFKAINDNFGHAKGDEILSLLGFKFKNIIRTNDMVARVGGDEFIIVLSDIKEYLFIKRVCQKLINIVKNSFESSKKSQELGVSIGISIYPDNGKDAEKLISNADSAMYHAKQNGKNRFEFFSEEMNKKLVTYTKKEEKLINAISNDEFIIHFQPEINTVTNDVFSLEVLTRWNEKDSFHLPRYFLEDLEISNLIYEFDKLILKKSCIQVKKWHEDNIYKKGVSVNISGKHLKYGDLYSVVSEVLEESKLEPSFLELEFNEEDIMKVSKKAIKTLNDLSKLGVCLAIDNFGKSFSSFNHLKDCAISKLKIDKSYIDSLLEDNNDEDIIKSIINLGDSMGIPVIAEGIEVLKQDKILKDNACENVQGYFYAKPMNSLDFENWYKFMIDKIKLN